MNGYLKLTAALAAFALLLVVMGLGTQGSVHAAPGDFTIPNKYLCSLPTCATGANPTNTSGNIAVEGGGGATLQVLNLDVARVTNVNPRNITEGNGITVVQEFTNPNTDGTPTVNGEIRAFNGNRIQVKYTPDNGFATSDIILVDNVKPTLVTNSPAIPLVVKGNTNVTFSADITDGGSGYTSTKGTSSTTADIDDKNGTPGSLGTDGNTTTPRGGVRLVVAGNVVALGKGDFTKIDGGWTVSKTLGSSDIQNISANIPWYFETRDRSGNSRRSSGSIPMLVGDSIDNGTDGNTADLVVVDRRFLSVGLAYDRL